MLQTHPTSYLVRLWVGAFTDWGGLVLVLSSDTGSHTGTYLAPPASRAHRARFAFRTARKTKNTRMH